MKPLSENMQVQWSMHEVFIYGPNYGVNVIGLKIIEIIKLMEKNICETCKRCIITNLTLSLYDKSAGGVFDTICCQMEPWFYLWLNWTYKWVEMEQLNMTIYSKMGWGSMGYIII